ncbi:MAG: NAD-glutamate dehydrogenase, partial [Lysobacter sp.]
MSTKPKAKPKAAAKPATAKSAASKGVAPAVPVAPSGGISLDPILAAMRKRLPRARHAEGEAFVHAFYKRMGEDELPKHSPEGWATLATDFLDFARARKTGSALVRLFNPNLKTHGWESAHTVLQVANDDMPFLVDTVTMALAEKGIGVHVLGHPVVTFRRDKAGKLVGVGEGVPESLMHLEIDRQPAEAMPQIEQAVQAVLRDVRATVRDWAPMRDKMVEVADELAGRTLPVSDEGRREAQEFLRWAAGDHFTLLGYREYEVVKKGGDEVLCAVKGSGLGLLRGEDAGKPR